MACVECKNRNYITRKNRRNDPDRIELKKFCPTCKKHTEHKETRQHAPGKGRGMPLNPDFIGKTYPDTPPYAIGREKLREFATAIGDSSPVFHDLDAARIGLLRPACAAHVRFRADDESDGRCDVRPRAWTQLRISRPR